jgi:polysaccharide deacetylase 2 family uncharacterized protein YibQ
MAQAKRKSSTTKPRARRKPTRRKKKQSGFPLFKIIAGIFIVIGLVALAPYAYRQAAAFQTAGMEVSMIESVLLAADIDPELDIQIVPREGQELWKIDVNSRNKLDDIQEGLKRISETQNVTWPEIEEHNRNGNYYRVIELPKASGGTVRMIFTVPQGSKSKPKPRKRTPVAKNESKSNTAKPSTSNPEKVEVAKSDNTSKAEVPPVKPIEVKPQPAKAAEPSGTPRIAIIIDDLGYKPLSSLDSILNLKFPITFAIIPHLAYSSSNAINLYKDQYEIILHMPMEPGNYPTNNPGEGAILSQMNEASIREAITKGFQSVPFCDGMNNHMGSKITANRTLMRTILSEVKERDMFYIDSKTSARSVAYEVAKSMDVATAQRHVFLDHEPTYEFVTKQLEETRQIADKKGLAIAIGHPYAATLQVLSEKMPELDRAGYKFIFASEAVQTYEW